MTQISKNERDYLESKGLKMGKDMFRTYSKHRKYYAVESPRVLRALKQYEQEHVIKTVTQHK